MSLEVPPVVCTLTTKAAAQQVLEWETLKRLAVSAESLPGGARMVFPAGLHDQIQDLANREASCCAFLDIALSEADGSLVLDVTSENQDARPVISALSGLEEGP